LRIFPEFPELSSEEYAYAVGYLKTAIRNLHAALDGLSAREGLCQDLREVPLDLARAVERRREAQKAAT
jgi:hypothetical protein